jgi:hypothetical protein
VGLNLPAVTGDDRKGPGEFIDDSQRGLAGRPGEGVQIDDDDCPAESGECPAPVPVLERDEDHVSRPDSLAETETPVVGERQETFRFSGKYPYPLLFEKTPYLLYPLLCPVKEIHLDVCSGSLLQVPYLARSQRGGVSIHRYDRPFRREEEGSGSLCSLSCALHRLLPDQVVERLPPSMGGEAFEGDDPFSRVPGQQLAGL